MKQKVKQKIVIIMASLCLMIGLMPLTAYAGTSYGNIQVTSDSTWGDTISYDAGSNTLTLTNCTLTNTKSVNIPAIYAPNGDLKLELVGTNNITANQGIFTNGSLTITGEGSLNVNGTTYALYGSKGVSISGAKVTASNAKSNAALLAGNGAVSVTDGAEVNVSNSAGIGISGKNGVSIENSKVVSTVTAESGIYAGISSSAGKVEITNSSVESSSACDAGIYAGNSISISGSTVTVEASSYGYSIGTEGNISISGGTVSAASAGAESNAIYAGGVIEITDNASVTAKATNEGSYPAGYGTSGGSVSGSRVEAESKGDAAIFSPATVTLSNGADIIATGYWPAIKGNDSVEISGSKVNAVSENDVAVYSEGSVTIGDSVVKATAPQETESILANDSVSVSDSWVEASYAEDGLTAVSDSVIFTGNTGMVTGDAVIPADVEIAAGMNLTVPDGTSLTIPADKTLTNHGIVYVEGMITRNGNIVCDSHNGGTATCAKKAECELCGTGYGDLDEKNHINLIKVEEKAATQLEEGNIEYYFCDGCGRYYKDAAGNEEITLAETVIEKLKGNTEANKTTNDSSVQKGKSDDKAIPSTGDSENLYMWLTFVLMAGIVLTGTEVIRRKQR